MTILVFGSLNMDLVVRAPRLPTPGETLSGDSFFTAPGGKGANQAVACARLGAPTRMIGRVGNDVFASSLRASLSESGVDVSAVATDPDQPSGVALISIDRRGENTILIVPGANGQMAQADVVRLEKAMDSARLLLLQLEIPMTTVIAAAQVAHQRSLTVILDPAPAQLLPPELYRSIDILTPNETEAAALTGLSLQLDSEVEQAASILLERGTQHVVIKLGGRGAYARSENSERGHFLPAHKVEVVDTVAAGDAFNGGLAVGLAEGKSFDEALNWAMAAGAISTTRPGAQPSMPSRDDVLRLLEA